MSNLKQPRAAKVTMAQQETLLSFMESHPQLNSGRFSDTFRKTDADKLWNEITLVLNCEGGPSKDMEKWKKSWSDWKCLTKAKATKMSKTIKKTGGGSRIEMLTPIEERLLAVIGEIAIEGNTVLPCPGFPANFGASNRKEATVSYTERTSTRVKSPILLEVSNNIFEIIEGEETNDEVERDVNEPTIDGVERVDILERHEVEEEIDETPSNNANDSSKSTVNGKDSTAKPSSRVKSWRDIGISPNTTKLTGATKRKRGAECYEAAT